MEIRGPATANLEAVRNTIASQPSMSRKKVYINRQIPTEQVEVIWKKGGEKQRVYQGPGSPENYNQILNSLQHY